MGSLLALGFAGRARTLAVRALAAAAPVLLVPTIYFTFGRGPWIAFAAGIAPPSRSTRGGCSSRSSC
ncbi:hypothetical protein BH18ACT13_BH18ACT13_01500 [soil metagenome]